MYSPLFQKEHPYESRCKILKCSILYCIGKRKKEEEKEWGKKRKCSHIPVSSSTKEGQLLRRHVTWHKFVHRVTDEHVRMLDVVPQVLPDLLLRRAGNVDEVTSDLDVRTVDDR